MIKVYTIKNCKYCVEAKDYLKKHNIQFEELDLSAKENREARKYYRELGVKIAPIITGINKKTKKEWIVIGFEEEKLKNVLKDGYD